MWEQIKKKKKKKMVGVTVFEIVNLLTVGLWSMNIKTKYSITLKKTTNSFIRSQKYHEQINSWTEDED